MVMQLLSISLSDLMTEFEMSVKTVLLLADQMIQHLEYIHSKHIIHGDLKPSNFLMGRGEKRNQVYLIDFGLCEEYRNPETKKHIAYSEKHGFHGTPRYCSLHVHNGIASSRRDDMESLGYVLVYLLLSKLPWQNLPAEENETKKTKRRKIYEMKASMPVEELCKGLPEEFVTYINITRGLKFKQVPDYYALRMLFRNLFMRLKLGSYDEDWFPQLERKKKKRRPRLKEDGAEAALVPALGPPLVARAQPTPTPTPQTAEPAVNSAEPTPVSPKRSPRPLDANFDVLPNYTEPDPARKAAKQRTKWERFLVLIGRREPTAEQVAAKAERKAREKRDKEDKERAKQQERILRRTTSAALGSRVKS